MTRTNRSTCMRQPFVFLLTLFFLVPLALRAASRSLQIYFIDVEGGQSTLLVDPQGESLLIDTGWAGFNDRDPDRIMAAVHSAGIQHIDYLVLTHYHSDHAGGLQGLAKRIRILSFADHGPSVQRSGQTQNLYQVYRKVSAGSKRKTVRPGDRIPFRGMRVKVLASAGHVIRSPLPGAGQPNPLCAAETDPGPNPNENGQSVGLLITFGRFRFIDLGDLTKQKELALVCPRNLIGTVDLYLTTHHGTTHPGPNTSNPRAIVDALHPRVAVMNNGATKGGSPEAWDTFHNSPDLQDLWQLHYSVAGGAKHNSARKFIANPGKMDGGFSIKVLAEPSGTFTVINSRNNFRKTYEK
ncbi:MAG TPA: MBL fold metallo-hydrolase [Terriglobia bacterium]|nr:MBL fold metallo-hydrolase [Terriglobia bacterium]